MLRRRYNFVWSCSGCEELHLFYMCIHIHVKEICQKFSGPYYNGDREDFHFVLGGMVMAKKLRLLLTRAFAKVALTILAAGILKLQKPFCGRCSDPLI